MGEGPQRLHAWSWLFYVGGLLKNVVAPLAAFLILGRKESAWSLLGLLVVLVFVAWSVLRARAYRYEVGRGELRVRDGVLDHTERHIPFARIQSVSQRSKFLHRVLGVTELRLESAAGGKPEAVMKVLSLHAAAELESLLRHEQAPVPTPEAAPQVPMGETTPSTPQVLHQLPWQEILRLGLISNRGMLLVGAALGVVMPNNTMRRYLLNLLHGPVQSLRAWVQVHDWLFNVVLVLVLLLVFTLVLRVLSVAIAFLKYHRFRLQLQDGKLWAEHGMSTQVRTGARLARLQSWVIDEGWLHRRFNRCRLGVSVAGNAGSDEKGVQPGTLFNEMAPIASPEQAQRLLSVCLPLLDWQALQWRSLHANASWRRVVGQLRWVLPMWLVVLWGLGSLGIAVPTSLAVATSALLALAMLAHARAWSRFAAYAQMAEGDDQVLVYRCGVFQKRWFIVRASRLQTLRLHSGPLDRRFGLVNLVANTQGRSRRANGLVIPCLTPDTGEQLRSLIWDLQR